MALRKDTARWNLSFNYATVAEVKKKKCCLRRHEVLSVKNDDVQWTPIKPPNIAVSCSAITTLSRVDMTCKGSVMFVKLQTKATNSQWKYRAPKLALCALSGITFTTSTPGNHSFIFIICCWLVQPWDYTSQPTPAPFVTLGAEGECAQCLCTLTVTAR